MSGPRTIWTLGLLISLTNAAYGDITPIRNGPKRPMVAPVKVVEGKVDDRNPNAVAKIVIPSSLLPDLQEPSYGSRVSNESPHGGTIIAGLALTAVAISLMMFANKTSPHWKKGMVCVIVCVLVAAVVLLANFFFPPQFIAPPADQSKTQSQIIIEIQKDGHEVLLVLPSRK